MNQEMLSRLKKAREKHSLMAVYRDGLEVEDYSGIPVAVGRQLVILHRNRDFLLDGYAALRLEDITELEQMDDNDFIRKVCVGEKLYDKASAPRLTSAEDWFQLLGGIKGSFGGWLAVECVSEGELCFYLGTISRVDVNFLQLRQVDADGFRHEEDTTVPLQDLLTVTFGDRYLEIYKKYTNKK
ncbi:hypothetical protein [Angelakisella massiliensis]|uniref:hypothetical protein n=1 Tax=Angelakisella massiliensis TaxID=1871018 RepID=UPI0008F8F92B|nr:hypothetical protein [Angelakisella massiliensis]